MFINVGRLLTEGVIGRGVIGRDFFGGRLLACYRFITHCAPYFHPIISLRTALLLHSISDATLDSLPDTFEKLFTALKTLLEGEDLSADEVIPNIKATTKLGLFLELQEEQEQLNHAAVDVDQIATQTQPDGSNTSAANTESAAVGRMRDVLEHVLVNNEIPEQKAKKVVHELEHLVLSETLTNVTRAQKDLRDLLIKFDVNDSENKSINSIIVDALKKGAYMLWKQKFNFSNGLHNNNNR